MQAENMLSGALKSLFAVSEAYPDLKANTNMQTLQEELTSTENKISFARQHYNDSVTSYHIKLEVANRATQHLYIVNPFPKVRKAAQGAWRTHPPLKERIERIRNLS